MPILKEDFEQYIRRFNAQDATAFDDYLAADMTMRNGNLRYSGVDGMKKHYAVIWKSMKETLSLQKFVCLGDVVAIELHTNFEVLKTTDESPFGPVQKGEQFDYEGLIMYQLNEENKFSDIKVSYLDFTRTGLDGVTKSLGIAH